MVTRQESEDVIRMLADRYPKCFFQEGKLRRPLKLDIISDLQNEKAFLDHELIAAGIEWYQSHLAYLHSLQAGARRLDLNGQEVSTVTTQEHIAAKAKIKLAHEKLNANATATLQEAMMAASTTLTTQDDAGLRAAMAAAALNVVRQEAQRVIDELNGG
jgi:ProP effector